MDRETINNIKCLAIDMIKEAGSGHPGIVLGAAPIIYTLYAKHLNISLNDLNWINRDRFVLSAGHGSALLYATLYMAGFNLTLDDLKKFRKIGNTPGHPEYGVTPGVEMSTGPLGQGFASAVGMALAGKILEKKHQLPKKSKLSKNRTLINYHVYVLCGDGDLMEGIANEAASLAGTWILNNLIVLYDSNNICLDGKTENVFTENVLKKFEAMGWYTDTVKDGLSVGDIDKAITKAKEASKPAIIEIKTVIGQGSLLQGTNEVHGKTLEKQDIDQLKAKLNQPAEAFYVNEKAAMHFKKQINDHSNKVYEEWALIYKDYVSDILGNQTSEIDYLFGRIKPFGIPNDFNIEPITKAALRDINSKVMNSLAPHLTNWVSGSADLSSSTKTKIYNSDDIMYPDYKGKNINFGVREHAMGAILNGLALSKLRPFGATFLAFADYIKPAIRLSALMNLPVTYIFTHDSVSVGEDGPTHQPVEQLAMLRSIPNFTVYRPCDAREIIGVWLHIINSHKPAALVISKQEVDAIPTSSSKDAMNGGYIINKEKEKIHGILIATGTEVQTAMYIAKDLYEKYKLDLRVVSMPSRELFLSQPKEYQDSVLPVGYRTIVIEAGSSFGWESFVYNPNYLITVNQFGISGKRNEVLKHVNFDYETIKERVEKLLVK